MLRVSNFKINVIAVGLLEKVGMMVYFENNEVILIKNNNFVGNEFCNHDLFVLNISENAYTSTYMVKSISLWHARFEYVNFSYIKNMQSLGLIFGLDSDNFDKCEICVEVKIMKKSYFTVNKETELLALIHTDLGDLKQTMTRGDKRYYVACTSDFF